MESTLLRLPRLQFSLRYALLVTAVLGGALTLYSHWQSPRLLQTGRPLDWMIEGRGYFMFTHPTGEIRYTGCGNIIIDVGGQLRFGHTSQPRILEPGITISPDWQAINISHEGLVTVRTPGAKLEHAIGQVQLANFMNPEGLQEVSRDEFVVTAKSGDPTVCEPGNYGAGFIRTGWLETSRRIDLPAWLPFAVIFAILGGILWELRALRRQVNELSQSRPQNAD